MCKKPSGLKYLEENNIEHQVRLYLKENLCFDELKTLVEKLGLEVTDLIRKQEDIYKKEYKGKELSQDEWVQAIVDNPKMLQRPLVESADKVVLAQPAERINEIAL